MINEGLQKLMTAAGKKQVSFATIKTTKKREEALENVIYQAFALAPSFLLN